MMQKILLTSLLFLWPLLSFSQTTLTLEEAVQTALENNYQLKQANNNLELTDTDVLSARADFLPSLNGSINGSRSIGRNFSEEEGSIINEPSDNLSGSLNTSLTVFDGFRNIANLRATEANRFSQRENFERVRETIMFETASRYLDVVLNQELLKIAESNLEASSSQLEQIEAQVEVGSLPTVDLYNQEATVANDELLVIQRENDLSVSIAQLMRIMQDETIQEIELSVPSTEELSLIPSSLNLQEMISAARQNRSDYQAQEYDIESNEHSVRIARSALYPSLSFNAGFGTNYTSRAIPDFNDQFFDLNINRNFGFSVQIPIFNQWNTQSSIQSAQIQLKNSRLELENIRFQISEEVRQAYNDYQSLVQELESTDKALIAAERAYETEQQRYEVGSTTLIELNQANANYVSAQSERVQTIYNFIFQEKLLDYFIGQLDENVQVN